jgi:hypothetical protein
MAIQVVVKKVEYYNIPFHEVTDVVEARALAQEIIDDGIPATMLDKENGWTDIVLLEDMNTGEQIDEDTEYNPED